MNLEEDKESLIDLIKWYGWEYISWNTDRTVYLKWIEEVKGYTNEHQVESMQQMIESLLDY